MPSNGSLPGLDEVRDTGSSPTKGEGGLGPPQASEGGEPSLRRQNCHHRLGLCGRFGPRARFSSYARSRPRPALP
jgi:hypothetical protein